MRLSLWTGHVLRALMYVGTKAGRLSILRDLRDLRESPCFKDHLIKVVSKLRHQGYTEPVLDRCGGIGLGRRPAQISVGAAM